MRFLNKIRYLLLAAYFDGKSKRYMDYDWVEDSLAASLKSLEYAKKSKGTLLNTLSVGVCRFMKRCTTVLGNPWTVSFS